MGCGSHLTALVALFLLFCDNANSLKLGFGRGVAAKVSKQVCKAGPALLVSLGLMGSSVQPGWALGPVNMKMNVKGYKAVELCNGQKPIMPGQKAMEGLFPVCLEVEADISNPDAKQTLKDVSVYGFVKEDAAGNSVLPNNPDFSTDAGQYAMIKTVEPGESTVKYQFVAAVSVDPKKEELPKISFLKTKATSFPGGSKFQPLSECEMDPRNCEAGEDD